MAVDDGGQLLAVVHGQRLGCFAAAAVVRQRTRRRRAVHALAVWSGWLSTARAGHLAQRWNTKEKRPRRAAGQGGLDFLHFPVARFLSDSCQSGFNLRQDVLIIQNWRVQRVVKFQRIGANCKN